jgi:hypothetical protein
MALDALNTPGRGRPPPPPSFEHRPADEDTDADEQEQHEDEENDLDHDEDEKAPGSLPQGLSLRRRRGEKGNPTPRHHPSTPMAWPRR